MPATASWADGLFTSSLRSKSVRQGAEARIGTRQVDSSDHAEARPRSRRKRTLLSFQRPGRHLRRKKGPVHTQGLRTRELTGFRSSLRLLRCGRLQGLSDAACSGSRGSVASLEALSNASEADECALPRLDDCAVEPGRLDLVAGDGLALELHPALVDLAAPVRARLAEHLLERSRQVDRAVCRGNRRFRHLVGSLVTADYTGKVLLPRPRTVRPVPARGDPPREL